MSQPTITVVVPVHNKERHAAESLRSILTQSSAAEEIIIVDDASSDKSMVILRGVAGDRARFLRREEPGPGGYAARNLGIEESTAEWIAFLDADDTWRADHLASIRAAIARSPAGPACVFTGYMFREPAGYEVADWFSRPGRDGAVFSPEQMLDFWLEGGCPLWTGAVAIRRDLLLRLGGFPAGLARRGGDRDLWLRTMVATPCIYTGEVTATYHRDADNMLTKAESFSVRQRVQDTVAEAVPGAAPEIAGRLRRIANREVFQYARKAWKGGAPITEPMIRDFAIRADPGKYALIRALRLVPMPFSQGTRDRVRGVLAQLRKRRHRSA